MAPSSPKYEPQDPSMSSQARKMLKKREKKRVKNERKAERRKSGIAKSGGQGPRKRAPELLATAQRLEELAKKQWYKAQKTREKYKLAVENQEKKEDDQEDPERLSDEQLFAVDRLPPWEKNQDRQDVEIANDPKPKEKSDDSTSSNKRKRNNEEVSEKKSKKNKKRARKSKSGEETVEIVEEVTAKYTSTEHEPTKSKSESKKSKKSKKEKKDKKKKKSEDVDVQPEATEVTFVETGKAVTDKKDKKKRKSKKEKSSGETDGDDLAEDEQRENPKSKKKGKKSSDEETLKTVAADKSDGKTKQGTEELERWNVQGLEGGSQRQAKFLKLLGGKKAGLNEKALAANAGASSRQILDSKWAEEDLEKQFKAGMKSKEMGGGKKRGLGAY
ncbi:hypothetical protein MKZ38_005259 [Zalerion maritima]|uniref:Small acidic protein-like domain-containing protein n=1 Tax=Zalerion maritima TaxID=339359 RepID=A0AAD5RLE6_9PEZI|nr:hypothetical protein MKZ38_005259 [Zalerion maritima]